MFDVLLPRRGRFSAASFPEMLVCHCNRISEGEVEQAILRLLEADPWQLIVPAKVYHAMGQRGRCCGCFPNVVEIIIRATEAFHAGRATGETAIVSYLDRVRGLRGQFGRRDHERRATGHRAA